MDTGGAASAQLYGSDAHCTVKRPKKWTSAGRPASRQAGQCLRLKKNWPDGAPADQDPHSFYYSDVTNFYLGRKPRRPESTRIPTVFLFRRKGPIRWFLFRTLYCTGRSLKQMVFLNKGFSKQGVGSRVSAPSGKPRVARFLNKWFF